MKDGVRRVAKDGLARPVFPLLGKGLEPHFRVLFSIIFNALSQRNAIRVESGGKNSNRRLEIPSFKVY